MAKKKSTTEFADSAHKVWLAGLGALVSAGNEGEKLFQTLVRRGEKVEDQVHAPVNTARARVRSTVKQARDRAGDTLESLSSTIDDTMAMALGRLGVPTRKEIASLGKRVEKLTRAVEAKRAGSKRKKTTTRKAPAKKASAKRATARKSKARKSTAGKSTTRKAGSRKAKVRKTSRARARA